MDNIWFTSDSHYNHSNICLGVSSWEDKEISCRKFQTLEEMNELLIKNINDNVKENDTLYHLGDWSFGGIESIWEFRKRINCKNIYLVPGNHDHHIKKNKASKFKWIRYYNGPVDQWFEYHDDFKTEEECLKECNKESFYKSYKYEYGYPRELFKEIIPQCSAVKINKQEIILSHYPIEEWENIDRGSIHLHGHCHHTKDSSDLNMYNRRMDVGIDWEEFRPFHLDEILILKNKPIKQRY